MTIIRILEYPDPRLRKKGRLVDVVDASVTKVINDMFETHYHADNCAALAATQLDFKDPLKITVIDFSPDKNQPMCLINPEIIDAKGEQCEFEGCMSVCHEHSVYERVKRAMWIKIKALDRDGKPFEMEAEGYLAKCMQHEIDHLNGVLYIDRLSSIRRHRLLKKMQDLQKKQKPKGR